MTLEIEKILTISAGDYCKMYGKKLSDYEAVGVHVECDGSSKNIMKFTKRVPENAEIVTDLKETYGGGLPYSQTYIASGTALILKKKVKK